jgi:hypothetical protein
VDSLLELLDCAVAVAAAGVSDGCLHAASCGCRKRDGQDVEAARVEEGAEYPESVTGANDQPDHRFGGHSVDALGVDLAATVSPANLAE